MELGLDQLNKPAPLWFRRMLNAIIIFVMPAFTGFVMGMPVTMMSTDGKNLCVSIGVFVTALLKALEYIAGDDSVVPKTNGNGNENGSGNGGAVDVSANVETKESPQPPK